MACAHSRSSWCAHSGISMDDAEVPETPGLLATLLLPVLLPSSTDQIQLLLLSACLESTSLPHVRIISRKSKRIQGLLISALLNPFLQIRDYPQHQGNGDSAREGRAPAAKETLLGLDGVCCRAPSPPWGPCPSLLAQAAPQEATLLGDTAHPAEMWLQGVSVLCQPW